MIHRICLLVLALCALLRAVAQPEMTPLALDDPRDVKQLIATLTAKELPEAARVEAAKRLALVNPPEALPALTAALDDPAFGVRQYSARALGLIGDRAAVPALIAHAGEPDPEARVEIVIALGRLADPRAVNVLAQELWDAEDPIRLAAARALGRIPGREASLALRGVLKDNTHPGAAAALRALGRRGDRSITPICLQRIAAPDFNDQTVAEALAEVGDPAAMEALAGLFDHPTMEIRMFACMGLARIGTDEAVAKLTGLMQAKVKDIRSSQEGDRVWAPALRLLTPEQADRFLAPWLAGDQFYLMMPAARVFHTRYQADFTLPLRLLASGGTKMWTGRDWLEARQPAEAVKPLLQQLNKDVAYALASPREWRDSSRLDGLLGPPSPPIGFYIPPRERGSWVSTPEIAKLLLGGTGTRDGLQGSRVYRACFSGDHAVGMQISRLMAEADEAPSVDWYGRGLAQLGDPCAIPALLKAMEHASGQARRGAMMGLTGCGDGRDLPTYGLLIEHLTAESSTVRQGAIVGLGCARDARAVPELIEVLQTDPVPEVREYAALALGLIGDGRAVEPLCQALYDNVEWARSAAAWALGEIGDANAVDFLRDAMQADKNPRFRERVDRSLYLLGDRQAAARLADLITSTDWITRSVAHQALLECREPGIAGSLLAKLAEQPSPEIIEALGRQRAPQAVPMLLAVLAEPEYSYQGTRCRTAACTALGLIAEGRGEELPEVADALYRTATSDVEPGVRAQAALALAIAGDARALERLEWVMQYYVPERNAAIRALWRIPDGRATELLLACLSDDDPLGKVLAAHGLCLRDEPRGPAALKALLLAATEPVARQVAIRFAADLRDPELTPVFAKLATAGHETAPIRIVLEAIAALGKSPGPDAVKALVPLLASPASRIREATALALKGTTDPAALAALRDRLKKEDATRVRTAMEGAVGGR
ncbi:MAG: HEAT repeat domain-containing protein [Armatimonadota bacterium]